MTLLEPPPELQSKPRAVTYAIGGVILVTLIVFYFAFRYFPEKRAVERFMNAVVAGNMNQAYDLWKPSASYKMQDFLADWGPTGYYGPIKSYQIVHASALKDSNGVILVIAISPYSPMPQENDAEKNRRTRFVNLFVKKDDKALSFPPDFD
jgi:hypothetical protein